MFAVRYLNNMELVTNKGLIVDFSLEDARQIRKRELKQDKQKKVFVEKKREEKQQLQSKEKKITGDTVVDLGAKTHTKKEKAKVIPID